MKQFFSTLVLVLFISGASFASFPVNNSNSNEKAAVESNEKDTKTDVALEKNSKAEKKLQKLANKIQGKMLADDDGGSDKDTTIAIILALVSVIFLPLGLHNWYLGRKKQALWQTLLVFPFGILLVTFLISWIWQIIDLFVLLGNGSLD